MKKQLINYPIIFCIILFTICFAVQLFECLVIKTDQTIVGENFINKVFGIVLLALVLHILSSNWKDIGFKGKNCIKFILYGFLMGVVFFTVSYMVEFLIIKAQGEIPRFEFFVSGFSLTGSEVRHTGLLFVLMCTFFNLINVVMEEGTFRGLYPLLIEKKHSSTTAIIIPAILFGVWHFSLPLQGLLEGSMSLAVSILMCFGYLILAFLMSVKWSFLKSLTGSLWMGLADHLFNNLVATNLLHVTSSSGTDSFMIVRVIVAQLLSFICVTIVFFKLRKRV